MNRRKKQYRGNNFIASERAVALSLGFVLLAGICITAFCLVMAANLPFWTKTFEAAHASAVADEFCDLATEINGTIAVAKEGGQNVAGTSVIKMKPDRVPIIGISPPGSCLEVRPDNGTIEKVSDFLFFHPSYPTFSSCLQIVNYHKVIPHRLPVKTHIILTQNCTKTSKIAITRVKR